MSRPRHVQISVSVLGKSEVAHSQFPLDRLLLYSTKAKSELPELATKYRVGIIPWTITPNTHYNGVEVEGLYKILLWLLELPKTGYSPRYKGKVQIDEFFIDGLPLEGLLRLQEAFNFFELAVLLHM